MPAQTCRATACRLQARARARARRAGEEAGRQGRFSGGFGSSKSGPGAPRWRCARLAAAHAAQLNLKGGIELEVPLTCPHCKLGLISAALRKSQSEWPHLSVADYNSIPGNVDHRAIQSKVRLERRGVASLVSLRFPVPYPPLSIHNKPSLLPRFPTKKEAFSAALLLSISCRARDTDSSEAAG